jgi:hypothetical protein
MARRLTRSFRILVMHDIALARLDTLGMVVTDAIKSFVCLLRVF